MTNLHRGEVTLEIGGHRHVLRLTLAALAEIEAAYGATDLQSLGERLGKGRISARDIITLLAAALRGGGSDVSDAEVGTMISGADLPRVIEAIGRLFALSFGAGEPSAARGRGAKPHPPAPQQAEEPAPFPGGM